jgi:hypothetical protein
MLERHDVPEVVVVVVVAVTVMFEKMNTKVKFHQPYPTFTLVLTVVVTGPCIGFSAGAIDGRRIPSAARVTQTITRALIASCLFKSVPSLLGDFGRSDARPAGLVQVQLESIPRENRV